MPASDYVAERCFKFPDGRAEYELLGFKKPPHPLGNIVFYESLLAGQIEKGNAHGALFHDAEFGTPVECPRRVPAARIGRHFLAEAYRLNPPGGNTHVNQGLPHS